MSIEMGITPASEDQRPHAHSRVLLDRRAVLEAYAGRRGIEVSFREANSSSALPTPRHASRTPSVASIGFRRSLFVRGVVAKSSTGPYHSRMATRRLSKSKYVAGLQCHRRLWLEFHEPDAPELEPTAAVQAIFDQGHLVGELAR